MHKYTMIDEKDYRPEFDNHEVKLIICHDSNSNVDIAYGNFTIIDDDMIECTEEEIELVESLLSNI